VAGDVRGRAARRGGRAAGPEFFNEYSLGPAARSGRMLVAVDGRAGRRLLELDVVDAVPHDAIWKLYVAPEAQRPRHRRTCCSSALAGDRATPEVRSSTTRATPRAAAFFDRLGFAVDAVEASGTARDRPPRPPAGLSRGARR
jgi:ribosomal protein S18 acetylase RimI-like enzyme